mmetsp:Transcript_12865/g.32943  ORF Transcript_12865/g.32943 Transcript_12865/m.32943 type:complete len:476 (-) Transcript_12865:110-1537(-)
MAPVSKATNDILRARAVAERKAKPLRTRLCSSANTASVCSSSMVSPANSRPSSCSSNFQPDARRCRRDAAKWCCPACVRSFSGVVPSADAAAAAATANGAAAAPQPYPPRQPLPPAPIDREKTTELMEPPNADMHDSVHDKSGRIRGALSESLAASSDAAALDSRALERSEPAGPAPRPPASVQGQDELMTQLYSLRKRLEGEQRKIQSEIASNSLASEERAHERRRQRRHNEKTDEVNSILQKALDQVDGYKRINDPSSVTAPGGASTATAIHQLNASSTAGGGGTAAPPVDPDALTAFSRLKYANLGAKDGASRRGVLSVYPEPPATTDAFDAQQQALLEAQERELAAIRAAPPGAPDLGLGGPSTLPGLSREASHASTGTFGSVNLEQIAAKNNERLRRLRNAGAGLLSGGESGDPDDVLDAFLKTSGQQPAVGLPEIEPRTKVVGGDATLPNDSELHNVMRLGGGSDAAAT